MWYAGWFFFLKMTLANHVSHTASAAHRDLWCPEGSWAECTPHSWLPTLTEDDSAAVWLRAHNQTRLIALPFKT